VRKNDEKKIRSVSIPTNHFTTKIERMKIDFDSSLKWDIFWFLEEN